jgi:transposase InsO family protein
MSANQACFPICLMAGVLGVWKAGVVGWAMANHLRTKLVLGALNTAFGQRRPRDVIHHSDQSLPRRRPGAAHIPRSLSASAAGKPACGPRWARSGMPEPVLGSAKPDPGHNTLCESFFATLECELLERRRFASQIEARAKRPEHRLCDGKGDGVCGCQQRNRGNRPAELGGDIGHDRVEDAARHRAGKAAQRQHE